MGYYECFCILDNVLCMFLKYYCDPVAKGAYKSKAPEIRFPI